ncbi:hypothetical protein EMIT0P265_90067 [Pseudomonas zeae]
MHLSNFKTLNQQRYGLCNYFRRTRHEAFSFPPQCVNHCIIYLATFLRSRALGPARR